MQALPNTLPPVTHYEIGPHKVVLTLGGADPKEITYLPQSLVDELVAALQRATDELEFGGSNAIAIRCMVQDGRAAIAKAEAAR